MRHVLVFREGSSVDDEDDARSCNDESVYVADMSNTIGWGIGIG